MSKEMKEKLINILFYSHEREDAKFLNYMKKYKKTNNKLLKIIYRYKNSKILRRNNASIPITLRVKNDKITFPHGLSGIYISRTASLGENCTIFHQVTIGFNNFEDSKTYGSPQIGDNVFIGAGAKIIGNVRIGNNVRIGANCIVVNDVPDNSTVVMNKPKVLICNKIRNNTFKLNKEKNL